MDNCQMTNEGSTVPYGLLAEATLGQCWLYRFTGCDFWSGSVKLALVGDSWFDNCTFCGVNRNVYDAYSLGLYSCADVRVMNSHIMITPGAYGGIFFESTAGYGETFKIIANQFDGGEVGATHGLIGFAHNIHLIDNGFSLCGKSGAYLYGVGHRIHGNDFVNCNVLDGSWNDIYLENSTDSILSENRHIQGVSRTNKGYAVQEAGGSSARNRLVNMRCADATNYLAGLYSFPYGIVDIEGMLAGYNTKASGIAVIPSGSNGVVVNHGLHGVPVVVLGAGHAEAECIVEEDSGHLNATYFLPRTLSGANTTANRNVFWMARCLH
jgi:hypothetical protein